MTKELDIVAIVPARGGSKRLPRKNVLPLAGKPLIQWTLDAARESGVIDQVVVTSDDEEVLEIASKNEDVMLIRRPSRLATDTATSMDVVIHVLDEFEAQGILVKRVMLLQPTSPLRSSDDIRQAVYEHNKCEQQSLVSVCEVEHPTAWCGTVDKDGRLAGVDLTKPRSQDWEKEYRISGAIYISCSFNIRAGKGFFDPGFKVLIIPRGRSLDIDDYVDYKVCEALVSMGVEVL